MSQDLREFADRFQRQKEFSTDYSPLYAHLFGAVADWLDAPGSADDPLVDWLLETGRGRETLDVSLLLAAGLHRDVLTHHTGTDMGLVISELAQYYPTAGGREAPDNPAFPSMLRRAIMARRQALADFIKNGNVQTNETGRGLCWVLPLLATGWKTVHLVDLGASAGLNLVADQRAYRLVADQADITMLDVGRGRPVQFVTRCQEDFKSLEDLQGQILPAVVSRTGCDLSPVPLATKSDELLLQSFIWGDQVERMERLREGIAAFQTSSGSEAAVNLHPANLPDELSVFLRQRVPVSKTEPVVLYNTYMSNFLEDKGRSLLNHIDDWASGQERPVVWFQWEMARDGKVPPTYSWGAWTVDLWTGHGRRQWQLGWTHPHGAEAAFGPGLAEWIEFWRN